MPAVPSAEPLDDGRATLAMIPALVPRGLRAVEEALQQEVRAPRLRARRAPQTTLPTPPAWPLFECSAVAAFECSVTDWPPMGIAS